MPIESPLNCVPRCSLCGIYFIIHHLLLSVDSCLTFHHECLNAKLFHLHVSFGIILNVLYLQPTRNYIVCVLFILSSDLAIQIESISDGIGMVYSGMGPDFR